MSSLLDPRIAEYTTVTGVDEGLTHAEAAYEAAQEALLALLEGGKATMKAVAAQEALVEEARATRDDLRGTRAFIVRRERERAEQDRDGVTFVVLLCRWSERFGAGDVARYCNTMRATNESSGVTGCIFVMRGWFALYVEGNATAVVRLYRDIQKDDVRFAQTLLVEKDAIGSPGAARRYPAEALRIAYVDGVQSPAQLRPEAAVMREIGAMMDLAAYVPTFNVANRGRGRFETTKGTSVLVDADTAAGPQCTYPNVARHLIRIAPFGDLWSRGILSADLARIIATVEQTARAVLVDVERRGLCVGLAGPHTQDGLLLVAEGNAAYCLDACIELLAAIRKDPEVEALYKPVLLLDHSSDTGLIVDGTCTVVGPPLRTLRKLGLIARQLGNVVLITYRFADKAERHCCHSIGTFVMDGDPAELFTHQRLRGERYTDEAAVAQQQEQHTRETIGRHVEGPGPIEPPATVAPIDAEAVKRLEKQRSAQRREELFAAGLRDSNLQGAIVPHQYEPLYPSHLRKFQSDAHFRSIYDKLEKVACPSGEDCVTRSSFDAYYHMLENFSAPLKPQDVDALLGPTVFPEAVTFGQFCLAMHHYQRL